MTGALPSNPFRASQVHLDPKRAPAAKKKNPGRVSEGSFCSLGSSLGTSVRGVSMQLYHVFGFDSKFIASAGRPQGVPGVNLRQLPRWSRWPLQSPRRGRSSDMSVCEFNFWARAAGVHGHARLNLWICLLHFPSTSERNKTIMDPKSQ